MFNNFPVDNNDIIKESRSFYYVDAKPIYKKLLTDLVSLGLLVEQEHIHNAIAYYDGGWFAQLREGLLLLDKSKVKVV